MTVSDATPLIALARIGNFSLLQALFDPLVIPPAVFADVVTRGQGRPGAPEVQAGLLAGWIRQQTPAMAIAPPYGEMRPGEVEAISLALELGAELLMDEGPGRRRAQQEGIFYRGTLDVLLLAKQAQLVPLVRPRLDALRGANFYLTQDLYDEVLLKAGES